MAAEKSVIPKGMTIEGDVTMEGTLELFGEIIGNVKAQNFVVAGGIKGDLDVENKLVIEKDAVVMGKINAGETNVELGAICEINMNSSNAKISATKFFLDYLDSHKAVTADDMKF